jgi:hypothetical protein
MSFSSAELTGNGQAALKRLAKLDLELQVTYVCMYACMHACMHVCMCVCMCGLAKLALKLQVALIRSHANR